jgi:mRNA interferase MazF
MKPTTAVGEVWRVDLGMAAKVRPVLVLSEHPADNELAVLVVVPHTTTLRGNRWEVDVPKTFLRKPGAFNLHGIGAMSIHRLEALLGVLSAEEVRRVKVALIRALNLDK